MAEDSWLRTKVLRHRGENINSGTWFGFWVRGGGLDNWQDTCHSLKTNNFYSLKANNFKGSGNGSGIREGQANQYLEIC